MNIKKIGVVGAGQMGGGIAHVSALAGFDVVLQDLDDSFVERGLVAMEERREGAAKSKWGTVRFNTFANPSAEKVREIEDQFLPKESQRDYEHTFGHYTPPS